MGLVELSTIVFVMAFLVGPSYCKNYSDGLIFYDTVTMKKILPPIVTSMKYRSRYTLPIGQPCSCASGSCGCCAGINLEQFNFNQKMCANMSYNIQDLEIGMKVFLNNRNIVMYKLSARNPPPFCIPVAMPIPLYLCMKLHNIQTMGYNVHMCMDWLVRVFSNDVFALHFNCVEFGSEGVHILPPEGQTESRPTDLDSDVYDEVDFEGQS